MDRSDLANRMKIYYENIPKTKLMRRCPVAVRLDGRSFHTFCRNFQKPFDEVLIKTMQQTMKYLCENIQGCVIAYQQSDEITLILIDYKKLTSSAFFDYEIQKVCSITASMATMAFNKYFADNVDSAYDEEFHSLGLDNRSNFKSSTECNETFESLEKRYDTYYKKINKAMFDSRCFNIPKEEVTNLLFWRQDDASRNSIQMVGRAYFSDKELHHKSRNQIQDMLMTQKGINWNDFPTYQKRGSCCIKEDYFIPEDELPVNKRINLSPRTLDPEEDEYGVWRTHWVIDKDIPIFKGEQGREYINRFIYVGE